MASFVKCGRAGISEVLACGHRRDLLRKSDASPLVLSLRIDSVGQPGSKSVLFVAELGFAAVARKGRRAENTNSSED
jgi:hypothetical protein